MLLLDERIGGRREWRLMTTGERLMFVPDQVRKCVCFIAMESPTDGRKLVGTGFFLAIPCENMPGQSFSYLVTSKHTIWGIEQKSVDKRVYIRLNRSDGSFDWLSTRYDQWLYHEDHSVDVAVLPFDHLHHELFDYLDYPLTEIVTEEIVRSNNIGLGDEVVVVGLFAKHYGRQRNIPIVRVGSVAAIPEEKITTIIWGNKVDIDAYLIDTRSIGGLSGSPVFVNLGTTRMIDGDVKFARTHMMYLLGLVHGRWNIDLAEVDVAAINKKERDAFNMGIAIVIPAFQIAEILHRPELKQRRREAEEFAIRRDLPALDAIC